MSWLRDYLRRRALRRRPSPFLPLSDSEFRIPGGRWAVYGGWSPERGGRWDD